MIKLNHKGENLKEIFNVSIEDRQLLNTVVEDAIKTRGETSKISWAVERMWIDERFSDNLKAYALFTLGAAYATQGL